MKLLSSTLPVCLLALFLSACGETKEGENTDAGAPSASAPASAKTVAPPAENQDKQFTADDVVKVFKDALLEAENPRKMTKDDYGAAPMRTTEGVRFFIPALGDNAGGRILIYDNQKDLEEMKNYYDEMGKSSAMLFSWTAAKGNVLVQINGDLDQAEFTKYQAALESLK